MQPEIEFELIVKIKGASLDQIDAGLTEAAGARIAARMVSKNAPQLEGKLQPGKVTFVEDKPGVHAQQNIQAELSRQTPPPPPQKRYDDVAHPVHAAEPSIGHVVETPLKDQLAAVREKQHAEAKAEAVEKSGRKPRATKGGDHGEKTETKIETKGKTDGGEKREVLNQSAGVAETKTSSNAVNTNTIATPAPTKDDVFAAISRVSKAYDFEKAREMLLHFKVEKIGQLSVDKYPDIIALCDKTVAEKQ